MPFQMALIDDGINQVDNDKIQNEYWISCYVQLLYLIQYIFVHEGKGEKTNQHL